MKKFIIFIAFMFFASQANALNISLQDNQTFFPGAGVKDLLPININIDNDNEITKEKGFSIVLQDDANIRFSSDLSGISITGSGSSKILTGASILPNMRVIKFNVSSNLMKGDNFAISGIKLIIYSKAQGGKPIGIDINGDNQADSQTINTVRVDSTYTYSDQLAPNEVFNFTGSITDNKITMSADMPGDVDFQGVQIDNYNASGAIKSSFFRPDLINFSYDILPGTDYFKVRTVDIRANYSTGLTFQFDYFRKPIIETSTGTTTSTGETNTETGTTEVICAQVITYGVDPVTNKCETFATPCDVPGSYKLVNSCVQAVEKYVGVFSTKNGVLLNKFVAIIDSFINRNIKANLTQTKKNDIIIIRNYIVKLLESYDKTTTRTQKINVINELAQSIKDLKDSLK
nr:hypothetical protein [Candidatus Gracilibacteria bacterium]